MPRAFVVCALFTLPAFGQFATDRWDAGRDVYVETIDAKAVRLPQALTGAAFSAVVSWQRTRTLSDGTKISLPPTFTRVWRDSKGNTRDETSRAGMNLDRPGRFTLTEIEDRVSRVFYLLDDDAKIAYRFAEVQGIREQHAAPVKTEATEVTVKLGSRNFEGVTAEGTRVTRTIPVGAIGNDRPLVSTQEEWVSPELHRPVLSIFTDPRVGNTVIRTTKISREEPDAALFTAPAGYAVVDAKDSVTVTLHRR